MAKLSAPSDHLSSSLFDVDAKASPDEAERIQEIATATGNPVHVVLALRQALPAGPAGLDALEQSLTGSATAADHLVVRSEQRNRISDSAMLSSSHNLGNSVQDHLNKSLAEALAKKGWFR